MSEKEIGIVRRYYSERGVAIVELTEDCLQVGDLIHIHGYGSNDFNQEVKALRCEGRSLSRAGVGQRVEVDLIEHARAHDVVSRMEKASPAPQAVRSRTLKAHVPEEPVPELPLN